MISCKDAKIEMSTRSAISSTRHHSVCRYRASSINDSDSPLPLDDRRIARGSEAYLRSKRGPKSAGHLKYGATARLQGFPAGGLVENVLGLNILHADGNLRKGEGGKGGG